MTMPSWKSSVDMGIEPGVSPPTSAWCARVATQPHISSGSPTNTGDTVVMSGRCVPPRYGSLTMIRSPGVGVPSA